MSDTKENGPEPRPAPPTPGQGEARPVDQEVQEEAGREREKSNYD